MRKTRTRVFQRTRSYCDQLDVDRISGFVILGSFYGFPQCCIKEMILTGCEETKTRFPKGAWVGTGFIPCITCAQHKARNFDRFVSERILANRICSLPFPYGGHFRENKSEAKLLDEFSSFYETFQENTGLLPAPDAVRKAFFARAWT